jgi:hypothetical protein
MRRREDVLVTEAPRDDARRADRRRGGPKDLRSGIQIATVQHLSNSRFWPTTDIRESLVPTPKRTFVRSPLNRL